MVRIISLALVTLLCCYPFPDAAAQQKPQADVGGNVFVPAGGGIRLFDGHVPQTRLQLRDLGIAPFDVIPAGETAITSLAVGLNGYIYGGTTGYTANLLVFSPEHNIVFPLGTIPGQESIHHALAVDARGLVYAGTSMNPWRQYHSDETLTQGKDWIPRSIAMQIQRDHQAYEGGHIYRYDPASTSINYLQENFRIGKPCPVDDLGIPVPHAGIRALVMNRTGDAMFGITYPGAQLFRFDIASRKTRIIGTLNTITPAGLPLPPIPETIMTDRNGFLYAVTDRGFFVRTDAQGSALDTLNLQLPGMAGRELFNTVTASVLHPGGAIFGGTTDGYLFRFDPDSLAVWNLGKPLMDVRIRALTIGHDGHVYGIGGADDGAARMFRYDTAHRAFTDFGMLEVSVLPYYEWKGLRFDAMVTGQEGSVYLGNSEHRSRLFIFNP